MGQPERRRPGCGPKWLGEAEAGDRIADSGERLGASRAESEKRGTRGDTGVE